MNCPRCGTALVEVGDAQGAMHHCHGCGGVFADKSAMGALAADGTLAIGGAPGLPHEHRRVDLARDVKCPVCGEIMSRIDFGKRSGVIVDGCREHGTWFDAEELLRAAAFVTAGGLAPEPDTRSIPPEEAARREQAIRAAAEMRVQLMAEGNDDMQRARRGVGMVRAILDLLLFW